MRLRIILGCLLIVVVALGVAAYQAIRWAEGPAVPAQEHPPSKVVVIPDGSTFQQVADLLERESLIKSSPVFVFLGKSQSAERRIHAGEYELNPGMAPAEILAKLLNGNGGGTKAADVFSRDGLHGVSHANSPEFHTRAKTFLQNVGGFLSSREAEDHLVRLGLRPQRRLRHLAGTH